MADEGISIDVERLRAHLMDVAGSAIFVGFPAALLDVVDIERASGEELLEYADRFGVDVLLFQV